MHDMAIEHAQVATKHTRVAIFYWFPNLNSQL